MGKRTSNRGRWLMVFIVLGLLAGLATVLVFNTTRSTVRVKDIAVDLDPAVPIGDHLLLNRIKALLAGQTYGNPFSSKMYKVTIEANVTNLTDQPQQVQIYYYYNAGALAFYSPGASSNSTTLTVAPGNNGPVKCPIEIQRPVNGANLQIGISTPDRNHPDGKTPGEFGRVFDLEVVPDESN